MKYGYIYKIINDINDKVYIGQTARDIDTRFQEHCAETRGHSRLHNAIQKYGWQHFKPIEVEKIPLEQLDEREKYWIHYYDSTNDTKGYNISLGGNKNFAPRDYPQIKVQENNIVFDSKEQLARQISKTTSWSLRFLKEVFSRIINTDKDFCNYHFISFNCPIDEVSDEDCQIDWIKTLNIQYQGTKIYCEELDKQFETIGQAAKYCKDNNLSTRTGEYVINTIISDISKYIKDPQDDGILTLKGLHFYKLPGSTKGTGSSNLFKKKKVICNELGLVFDSQKECAEYLINNNIWTGIKLKTATLRISDIVNGVFSSYKNLSFKNIEE